MPDTLCIAELADGRRALPSPPPPPKPGERF